MQNKTSGSMATNFIAKYNLINTHQIKLQTDNYDLKTSVKIIGLLIISTLN